MQCEDAEKVARPDGEAAEGTAEGAVSADAPEPQRPREDPQSPSPTASKENEGDAACGNSAAGVQAALDRVQYGCSGVAAMGTGADAEQANSSMSSAKEATLSPSHFLLKECC